MKKLHILIPSLVATVGMPFISLASCGGDQPSVTTYTVTFELGEGSIEGLTGKTMTVNENTTYGMLPSPKLTGFNFDGWTVGGKDVKATDVITSDITVTAKWSEIKDDRFDVTIESDNMLDISNNEGATGFFFWTIISHHEGYDDGNWIIPDNKIYYDVTVDGEVFYDFEIMKINEDEEDEFKYDILFYIVDADAEDDINIKVKPYCKYLTFTLADDSGPVNFKLKSEGTVDITSIKYKYSLTDDWTDWNVNSDVDLNPENKQIYIWNPNTTFSKSYVDQYLHFVSSSGSEPGGYYASGNIMSLLNFGSLHGHCFSHLFDGSVELRSAPTLPATTIEPSCYNYTFKGCTNINEAILPAETIDWPCYELTFRYCSNLKKIKVGFGTKGQRDWPDETNMGLWLDGVSPTGTFIWKGSPLGPEVRDEDTVPPGWEIQTWG